MPGQFPNCPIAGKRRPEKLTLKRAETIIRGVKPESLLFGYKKSYVVVMMFYDGGVKMTHLLHPFPGLAAGFWLPGKPFSEKVWWSAGPGWATG